MAEQRAPTAAQALRALLRSGEFIVAPGVYDGYSARLAETAGFRTLATGGAAIANSLLGVPDIGLMGLAENVGHCRNIIRAVSVPVTCDADNGYGNPVNVHYTVEQFEAAGAAGVNIEDQIAPKRCGHMPGKEVVSLEEMVKKIEAACLARRDDAFVVIARTNSLAIEGIEGAVRRARAYAAAGADMLFPDAVRTEDDIARLVDEAGIPVTVNMGFGIRSRPTTPLIPLPRLRALGVRRVSLPRMLSGAAVRGMQRALEQMRQVIETGEMVDRPDLVAGIDEIWSLMGLPAARELERRLLTTAAIEAKYAEGGEADAAE